MVPEVSITAVWQDADVIEVVVSASNGAFAGRAELYTTDRQLRELATAVEGFPRSVPDERRGNIGTKDPAVEFAFRTVGPLGNSVVTVALTDAESGAAAQFPVPIEATSIDHFVRQLRSLAELRSGCALLPGVPKRVG